MNLKFPRPLVEKGFCGAAFMAMDNSKAPKMERHCEIVGSPYKDPLALQNTKVKSYIIRLIMIDHNFRNFYEKDKAIFSKLLSITFLNRVLFLR